MAKQCPNCRAIVSAAAANCNCGFRFFSRRTSSAEILSGACLRIAGGVLLLAGITAVIWRILP